MKNIQIQKDRIFGLDLMRFVAIALVVLLHGSAILPKYIQDKYFSFLYFIDGVDIFFVLSGFLIGQIILKDFSNSINYKNILEFYKNRWLRTLPLYYVILFLRH